MAKKKCPDCSTWIAGNAWICRECGRSFILRRFLLICGWFALAGFSLVCLLLALVLP